MNIMSFGSAYEHEQSVYQNLSQHDIVAKILIVFFNNKVWFSKYAVTL